jgi:hypothetical protein
VSVRWPGKASRQWWCGFCASVSTQEGRREDKALQEDKAEVVSSSWLYVKEA